MSAPQPPNVVQYPNVLTPPQDGGLETIESYQYSEVVELLSDGPVYGLVNKNGAKVDGVNLFEGVYFNDSPVKETSDLNYECFDMLSNCISSKLHDSWSKPIPSSNLYLGVSAVDNSFNVAYICIKTYSPADSLNYLDKNKKIEWLSSAVRSCYELFLTEICIPTSQLTLKTNSIDLSIVDQINNKNTINFDIYDLSQELYPLISTDLFNSFNYFEIPKSSVVYSSIDVSAGKIKINGVGGNIIFKIWGSAKYINGYLCASYHKDVLDKYFNLFAYQNKESLYNFNSVQVEFKNGSQFQNSIESIKNIEIDYSINKTLVGPFDNSKPVQRLKSFLADSSRPPLTNVNLESEGSADNRYVKSWPVEYNSQNSAFLICDITMSYSSYDSTTSNIRKQDAYPYTHHILNQNVECVYITIGLNQLSDTAHVDLAAVDTTKIGSTKYKNTELPPMGVGTYESLDISKKATYWYKNTNPGTAGNPGSLGGNLPPTCYEALKNQQQSINVGSKLPSIVSFKIETGYEADTDGNKDLFSLNSSNYYAYRYDIFGIVQNPNTNLDFGRSDLSYSKYVYSHKSNIIYDPLRQHKPAYEAYETITNTYLNNYDATERATWYSLKYINTNISQNYYFDALTNPNSAYVNEATAIRNTILAVDNVDLYSAKSTTFTVNTKIFKDRYLEVGFGDGIVYEEITSDIYVIYEIKNSIITRISTVFKNQLPPTVTPTVTPVVTPVVGNSLRSYDAYAISNPNIATTETNLTKLYTIYVVFDPIISNPHVESNIKIGSIIFRDYTTPTFQRRLLSSESFFTYSYAESVDTTQVYMDSRDLNGNLYSNGNGSWSFRNFHLGISVKNISLVVTDSNGRVTSIGSISGYPVSKKIRVLL